MDVAAWGAGFRGAHLHAEAQLAYASGLVVVPDHHLVGGVARRAPAPHQRQDVAAEQHLHHADAPRVQGRTPGARGSHIPPHPRHVGLRVGPAGRIFFCSRRRQSDEVTFSHSVAKLTPASKWQAAVLVSSSHPGCANRCGASPASFLARAEARRPRPATK